MRLYPLANPSSISCALEKKKLGEFFNLNPSCILQRPKPKSFEMKFLKTLLLIVAILVGVWMVLNIMGPKNMNTVRSTTIDAPASMVYAEVVDFKKWQAWSPWVDVDPTMVTTYEGAPSGEGAIMKWDSEEMGGGEQTMVEAVENKSIRTELVFTDWEGTSAADWTFEEKDGKTEVSWSMESSEFPFMARGIMLLMGGADAVAKDYDKGLASLKQVVENKPKWSPKSEMIDDMWYIGIERDSLTVADLADGAAHGPAYQALGAFVGANGIVPSGMPMCIPRRYSEESMDLTFAFPIPDSVAAGEGMTVGMIPGGKSLYTVHYGPYEGSDKTWEMFEAYINSNEVDVRHYPFEVYTNDPATVSPDKIETKIVYPVN